jgi:hypothetical protein
MESPYHRNRATFLLAFLAIISFSASGAAEERDFRALAKRIVHSSANVQSGEMVVVASGQHTLPLAEAIVIEARNAGALCHHAHEHRSHFSCCECGSSG